MLRAGYVDVALVFRYSPDQDGMAAGRERGNRRRGKRHRPTEGLREKLLLDEPVHLVTAASAHAGPGGAEPPPELAGYARHRWIAGCDRCRANLLRQCALAGFTPKIAFTTDDYVAVQALVAAGLGVSTLPASACGPRGTPGSGPCRCPAPAATCSRYLRRPARPARGEAADGGAPHRGRAAAAPCRQRGR